MEELRTKPYSLAESKKVQLREKIKSFLESRRDILFAYLHGTFIHGENFRDVDIALYLDKKDISGLDYELDLEVLLQDRFGYPFDVRLLNGCPVSFAFHVIKEGERVYVRDDDQRTRFEEGVLGRYLDFLFYHKRYLKEGFGVTI